MFWDTNGFWLYYRRLEKGRFQWPAPVSDGTVHITRQQLLWSNIPGHIKSLLM
ncbi:IS66 family insertion sequence element accessory protein TnpB [Photorhabdus hainanensis]|uniref:IS66 family insertion sequence element accessory protein TnpB n=1 Tax=Photorhabdus hainanensis TaxID=1004166 RepID=UPI003BB638CC